jgi:hypothetical protein
MSGLLLGVVLSVCTCLLLLLLLLLLLFVFFLVVLRIPPCLLSLAKFVRQLDVYKDVNIVGKTTDTFQ